MDLPNKQWYGVRCPLCIAVIWSDNKSTTELRCTLSFKDKGLPYIEESLGIVIGYGRFEHTCRPDLDT